MVVVHLVTLLFRHNCEVVVLSRLFFSSFNLHFFFSFVIVTDSPNIVTTLLSSSIPPLSSLCVNENQHNVVEQAQELLNTIVQLANRQEIEQLKNRITV
jgi:hypothetical protein